MALTRPRSPSRRSLIGLGLKRNAAEVSSQVGYTINGSRLNRDSNEARRIAANIAKLPELMRKPGASIDKLPLKNPAAAW
jgi:hypothetical protein